MPQPLLRRPFRVRRMERALRQAFADPDPSTLSPLFASLPGGVEEARVAVAAAYDTTAHAMAFALWELAARPELNVPDAAAGVVHEALRLYPSGWIGSRVATEDTEFDGYPIPAGRLVLYSPYLTHRERRPVAGPVDLQARAVRRAASGLGLHPLRGRRAHLPGRRAGHADVALGGCRLRWRDIEPGQYRARHAWGDHADPGGADQSAPQQGGRIDGRIGRVTHWTYAAVLGACLLLTLPLEFVFKAGVYGRITRTAMAVLPVAAVFAVWDLLATGAGWWWFGEDRVLGLFVGPLPIEEWLFFLVVPVCALLTVESVRRLRPDWAPRAKPRSRDRNTRPVEPPR